MSATATVTRRTKATAADRCASPRRQSHRVKKNVGSRPATPSRLPPTPRTTPPPSAASSPRSSSTTTQNRRCSTPAAVSYVALAGSADPSVPPPIVNWDVVTYVVSDQKINTTTERKSTHIDALGKMVTTTTTMTVTTTVATTEILHPGDEGYEESLAKQRALANADPVERAKIESRYRESRVWSAGKDKSRHEGFHRSHHQSARPAVAVTAAEDAPLTTA